MNALPDDRMYETEITCPWCGHEHDASFEREDSGEDECEECGKPFEFYGNVQLTYCTKPKGDAA